MELFGIVCFVVAMILIGIGIALGLVASVIAAVLLALGVISSSVLVGVISRQPFAGVRAFLFQCCILAGIPAGAVCAWLAQSIFAAYGSGWLIFIYGAFGGALAGAILAITLDCVSRRIHRAATGSGGPSKHS